jgi:thiol-disulfide isomerase/thioredoxin
MYADPWSYGTPDANFSNWDLFFPFAIAGYIYWHRHGRYLKSNKAPTFTSDGREDFVVKSAMPLKINHVVRGNITDTEFATDTITVVLFWASWCSACQKAFPVMDRLQKKYQSKAVKFVALSQDDEKDIRTALRNMKCTCDGVTFATEDGASTKNYMIEYDVSSIPHCFVVGKDRNMVWHGHPIRLDKILHVRSDPNIEQESIDGDWEKVGALHRTPLTPEVDETRE